MLSLLHPLRAPRKDARFVLVAVLTLAVGIGANAAIFTVVDAVLLRPLPFPEPERLMGVWHKAPGLKLDKFNHSDATYLLYRKHSRTLESLGIWLEKAFALAGGSEPERLRGAAMTASTFTVLRVPPALGRALVESDERPGAEPVAVLSDGLWRRRFGADRRVVGTTARIDGVARRIVGVMPAGFHFPSAEEELWVPITIDPARVQAGDFSYDAVGRLRPGATAKQAERELSQLVWRLPEEYGGEDISRGMIESAQLSVMVHPRRDDVVGDVQRILWVLLGSVGFILLIACANVANLFLVRAEGRTREVAVRTALGASRWDIARTFLAESLALSLPAGALGLALAAAGIRMLVALRPQGIPRLEEIGVGTASALFTLALSLAAGLAFGAVAALRYGAPALVPALKEGGRGGGDGRTRRLARNVLVAAQVTLALVLLVGCGLMVKSFWNLRHVDPGVDPHGVLTLHLSLPEAAYPDSPALVRFVTEMLARVEALPGVAAAGTISELPLAGQGSQSGHTFEDFPLAPDAIPTLLPTRYVTPGYFRAMGIPLVAGRGLGPLDPARQSADAVVSASMAKRFWPHKSPLGRHLSPGKGEPGAWSEIVGVVKPVRELALQLPPGDTVYYPLRRIEGPESGGDRTPRNFSLVVRGPGGDRADAAALAGPVRRAIWSLDPNLPVAQVRTMEEVVESSTARTSFTMLLLLIAAAVALLLGSVGIYGVISYVVSQRTREIGVRMAIGARRNDIARMVIGEGALVVGTGIALGLASAFALTRLMGALLFEVSATDPPTFAGVPVVLAAVALAASYLPARRAAAVEPLAAIRCE
jgi:putative ABC transport system permease protein